MYIRLRWNSTYDMMKRIYELARSIRRVLEKDENSIHQDKNLTQDEVSKVKDLIRGLHGFYLATLELSVSRSRIIPILTMIDNKVY